MAKKAKKPAKKADKKKVVKAKSAPKAAKKVAAKPAPAKKPQPLAAKKKAAVAAKPEKKAAAAKAPPTSLKKGKAPASGKMGAAAKATPKTLQSAGKMPAAKVPPAKKGAPAKDTADKADKKIAKSEPLKPAVKDIVLTDAEGRILCRVKDCDQHAVVEAYCRFHYLLFWKKIQNRKKILSEGKLEQYIEELTSRYPLKFLELIRKDLSSEPDFLSAIQELDIDEGNQVDEFGDDENFMDEVRGISSGETERVDEDY